MANSTEREPGRFRLAMDSGEVVEVDGSTLLDDDSGQPVPAVVLRMPAWRAHALGHVLASWNEAVDLFEAATTVSLDEFDLAWALHAASAAVGDQRAREEAQRPPTSVPSGHRARAAVLRDREAFEVHTLIAVVDAASWWLDQPHGDSYCTSLLAAVTDQETAGGRVPGADRRPARSARRGGTLRPRARPSRELGAEWAGPDVRKDRVRTPGGGMMSTDGLEVTTMTANDADHVGHHEGEDPESLSLDELARRRGVKPVYSVEDMARPHVFESDEELEEFLAFTAAKRRANLA